MIHESDIIQLIQQQLQNMPDIIDKYNIFYNGKYIIAEYKQLFREYKETLDRSLIIKPIIYTNNKGIIIKKDDIFNSDIYNFYIVFENINMHNIDDLYHTKLHLISRDILFDDIRSGIIKNIDGIYILNQNYIKNKATRNLIIE